MSKELEKMSLSELRKKAAELGIEASIKTPKKDLIAMIQEKENGPTEGVSSAPVEEKAKEEEVAQSPGPEAEASAEEKKETPAKGKKEPKAKKEEKKKEPKEKKERKPREKRTLPKEGSKSMEIYEMLKKGDKNKYQIAKELATPYSAVVRVEKRYLAEEK